MTMVRKMAAAVLVAGSVWALHGAQAQAPGIHRTDLVQNDIGAPGREIIQVRVDIEPGVVAPNHSHPGEEVAYVLEGTLEYRLEGRPPVTLRAGEALFIPDGVAHVAKNVGSGKASELATYVVKKGAPLVKLAK